jgi:hypothetical protein
VWKNFRLRKFPNGSAKLLLFVAERKVHSSSVGGALNLPQLIYTTANAAVFLVNSAEFPMENRGIGFGLRVQVA